MWAEIFPDADYGFKLTLRRGAVRAFFWDDARDPAALAERGAWLARDPTRYVVATSESLPAWAEFGALAATWSPALAAADPKRLAAAIEPDVVLLTRAESGAVPFRVRGGAVVFPTGWSLPEKIGLTLAETHGVVPGLNTAIGAAIDRFLDRLRPETPAERWNWGLAATAERNLHPALSRPRLTARLTPETCWLRVEHQLIAALPASGAIVFGIRILHHRLDALLRDPLVRARLQRALITMPAAVATYKGLEEARPTLLAWTAAAPHA